MRILGVDPGIALTGVGIVDAVGHGKFVHCDAVRTKSDLPHAERLNKLYDSVRQLIDRYEPDVLAIERLFFNKNSRSAMAVAEARGVVVLAAARAGLPVHEFTPLQVKSAVTGQGRADKAQVGYMVKMLLKLSEVPRPDDVTDALAVALACGHLLPTTQRWSEARGWQ